MLRAVAAQIARGGSTNGNGKTVTGPGTVTHPALTAGGSEHAGHGHG